MGRFYYSNIVSEFLRDDPVRIFGQLTGHHPLQTLTPQQKEAWRHQILFLQQRLRDFEAGQLFFEFSIPRMGKRVDCVLVYNDIVFVIEFKVGYDGYEGSAIDQVVDYTVDLKNFHQGSHTATLIPVLVVTNAPPELNSLTENEDLTYDPLFANSETFIEVLNLGLEARRGSSVNPVEWGQARYKPTPTIVEAAQALYAGHKVEEIARTDADDTSNLSTTSDCIQEIIDASYHGNSKSICFVTGVPGAGKTLAGLNIAINNMDRDRRHATYMSGNFPLVKVLREALSRNRVAINKQEIAAARDPENPFGNEVNSITLAAANDWARTIIQAIHEFRLDQITADDPPAERVVVFDESQRAWTREKLRAYLGPTVRPEITQSEPEFLIGEFGRHDGFCTIICLVGGGQEIHDGEAGLEEWFRALRDSFPDWQVFYSDRIIGSQVYLRDDTLRTWIIENGRSEEALHLDMPVRSFRSDKVASFVEALLDGDSERACEIHGELRLSGYPVVITRDLERARVWLRDRAKGTNRTGLVASSGGLRLKPHGIFVKMRIDAPDWFLKGKDDVRSSYFLEDVATEFDIQGLELDWIGLCWDGDFYFDGVQWQSHQFSGSVWKTIRSETDRRFLKNTYRVLLTRARQGMVIFLPHGSSDDETRPHEFYDGTFCFLKRSGLPEI